MVGFRWGHLLRLRLRVVPPLSGTAVVCWAGAAPRPPNGFAQMHSASEEHRMDAQEAVQVGGVRECGAALFISGVTGRS